MSGHDCTAACGGICHLNATAQAHYLDMVYADRFDQAESFRRMGWSA